jgi:FAD/FMN-containing dehydrogenase
MRLGSAIDPHLAYATRRAKLLDQYAALPDGAPVRLAKRTSNLFRSRSATTVPGLDVASFDGVLGVDPETRTADVQGMTTYARLVDATLPFGLMPLVVPQLKTITLGGAVTGLGIESTSFRNGLPHESVLEMEIMTGAGEVVVARPDNEHRALYYGFPNSYGTLGYALRLRIELEQVQPFVRLRHLRHDSAPAAFEELASIAAAKAHNGDPVHFLDATVFGPDEIYLTLGTFSDAAPYTSDYTRQQIYYRSIQQRSTDFLTIRDYLWRWDTDWFWCSRAFGVQRPLVRRLVPKRYLRSDVYWRLVALEGRFGIMRRVDRLRGRPDQERVIQDVEVPIGRAAEFYDVFHREVGISPVWACPLRQRHPDTRWDLYVLEPETMYVNFGFWSTVDVQPGAEVGACNRRVEDVVAELGGRKSLYSDSYYSRDRFWRLYGGATYDLLKKTYDPQHRLLDLYQKCVERR